MSALKADIRSFYRNALRMTAKEIDSRNLLIAVNRDIYMVVYGNTPKDPVFQGIQAFCSDERPGTVIMDWSPLKRYLKQANTDLAQDYQNRIEEIETERMSRNNPENR